MKRQESSSVAVGEGQLLARPKRQAPPPPVGRMGSVDQSEERASREPPQGAEVRDPLLPNFVGYVICCVACVGS